MNEVNAYVRQLGVTSEPDTTQTTTFLDYVTRVAPLRQGASSGTSRDMSPQGMDSMLFSFFESQYETQFLSAMSSMHIGDSECSMCHRRVSAGDHFADVEFPGTKVWVTFCDECFAEAGFSLSAHKAFLYRKVGTGSVAHSTRWCLVGGFRHLATL